MNRKFFGILLIVVGIALLLWGYDRYDSVGAQINRAFSGDTPMEAWIGLVGGALCIAAGVLRLK